MTDIIIDDLTNGSLDPDTNEWTGTGILDKLLYAINKNIEGEYNKNRITGSDYANVYLGAMQAALAQSMQYLLQEKVQEAQIDDIRKGIELKDAQIVSIGIDDTLKSKQLEIAEIERLSKLYEKDTLLIDQHNTNLKQQTLLDTEEEAKQYEVDTMLPTQVEKINQEISNMISDTEFKDREVTQQELTSDKQREHLTKEIEILSQKKVGRAQ